VTTRVSPHLKIGSCRRIFLSLIALCVFAHRLPAPIQEIPESPTPAPEQQMKPKKTQSKSKAVESEPKIKSEAKPSAKRAAQGPARFAGTWTGTINQGILGNIEISLVIDTTRISVKEISKVGTFTHPATTNGNMLTWRAGWLNEIAWTFTPASDGKTAAATSKSGFGVNGAAIFRKQ